MNTLPDVLDAPALKAERALKKLTRARSALVVTQPFWGCLALNLKVEIKTDLRFGTMATDGETLFADPDFTLSLSDPELRGVIAHEVSHVARLHHVRRGRRDPKLFNKAADYAINPDLLAGRFKLPEGGLNEPRFAGMSAEAIYAVLAKEEAQKPKPAAGQQGKPQAGHGAPGHGEDFGEVLDAPGGAAGRAKAEAKAQEITRQAAMVARAQGTGNLPGFVKSILAELDKPVVDWRATLRRFADESSIKETCWTRPNRRHGGEFILPGAESSTPSHLVCFVDTSGSMSNQALAKVGAELQAMLDESAVEQISVCYADTDVRHVDVYTAGDSLTLTRHGGGGTMFAPAFAWLAANEPDASAVAYFSDLDAYDIAAIKDPGLPTLWIFTDPGRARPMPFGETIHLDPHAD